MTDAAAAAAAPGGGAGGPGDEARDAVAPLGARRTKSILKREGSDGGSNSNGVGNGSPSLIKAGEGTLTIAPPLSAVNGLGALGTNTMSGLFMPNQGTAKLGSNNANLANHFFSAIGGTLDLNGKSQLFYGTFTESTVTNQGTNITSTNGAGHLLINGDTTGRQFAGRLTGNVSLTRSGFSTTNFWGVNSHTGTTTLNGGTVVMYGDAAFTDTSALNSPIRSGVLKQVKESGRLDRFLHGSDFPVPVGALWVRLRGLISTAQWREAGRIANLIERDAYLKRAIGFDDTHFTRLGEVLRPV